LTGVDNVNFRSAISECLVAWFLSERLCLRVVPYPPGRAGHVLDLGIDDRRGLIYTEVKAPHRAVTNSVWCGDDSDVLQTCLEDANTQFESGVPNLLVIVPRLRVPVFAVRRQLTRAFFGDLVLQVPVDPEYGGIVGPPQLRPAPSGHFLATHLPSGRPFKPTGTPRFTRVGAVLSIEEWFDGSSLLHRALLVHNPFAHHPLPRDIWSDIPQFLPVGGEMRWSDDASPWQ